MPAVTTCRSVPVAERLWLRLTISDTANSYQKEESEIWIGEWLQKTGQYRPRAIDDECRLTGSGVRDDVVIATKYTANVKDLQGDKYPVQINRSGNSYKSMMVSLEDSLKKLGTTYVDILCEFRVSDASW